jgi:NAD(P)H-dependent FMN reductase
VLTICGSLQAGGANRALLETLVAVAPAGVDVHDSISIGEVPHFNPDLPEPGPDGVQLLRRQIAAADAVVIATPEYAHSLPGVLKNALDWIVGSGEFYEMPVAVLAAAKSPDRGERGRAALEATLRAQGARVEVSQTIVPEDTSTALRAVLQTLATEFAASRTGRPPQ